MSRIVTEARRWIGTPYVHQASVRGAGTDCLGLIRGVWRAVHGVEPEVVPRYSADWAEPQGDEVLWQAAGRHMVPVARGRAFQPGECLLFRLRDGSVAKHLGIVGEAGAAPSFIHAYSGQGVVESPLSRPWARRIAARFDFPA
ncbi:NlpC/P60 family protein [Jannaschia formosa]|uniref:NlpC/P60 family protein n=1 Tax=Jannaschia formosa TaxID=2259592 RepID=UPI000E1C21F6|nr:NlpC/P60 family protein [Jannaschia formosa]TFL18588.1 peptidase [Jannaschia formosa]